MKITAFFGNLIMVKPDYRATQLFHCYAYTEELQEVCNRDVRMIVYVYHIHVAHMAM